MWLANKYTRIYETIIDRATTRQIDGYTETHHIVPRSLGGTDDTTNLVRLTAREHFICHLLLTKMTTGLSKRKMSHAAFLMAHGRGAREFVVHSRTYARLVRENNAAKKGRRQSEASKKKNADAHRGKKHSQETREKQSRTALGKKKTAETRRHMSEYWKDRPRQKHTEETKLQIAASLKGRNTWQVGVAAASEARRGTRHSAETKAKMRGAQAAVERVRCEDCGAEVRPCHLARWHGSRCKP